MKLKLFEGEPDCMKCGLYRGAKSPRMSYTGKGEKGVLIVAEAPGKTEDEQGVQLVGRAGQYFRSVLKSYGWDLDRDCWKINAVNCYCSHKPTRTQISCCRPMVERAIKECRPRYIWLLGECAIASFFSCYFGDCSPTLWRKFCIPDRRYKCWVIPLFHPSFVIRNERDEGLSMTFERDVGWAIRQSEKERTWIDFSPESQIDILLSEADVILKLKDLKQSDLIAFDYETTGLKPFAQGHRIISVAVSNGKETFVFPFQHRASPWLNDESIKYEWTNILLESKIKKIAHNVSFEDLWSRVILNLDEVKGWFWDTKLVAHLLDNRKDLTHLKFLAFVNWGLVWTEKVKPYLGGASSNEFNKLEKVNLKDLCLYNGIDALMTWKIFERQFDELKHRPKLKSAFDLFFKGQLVLSKCTSRGLKVDLQYYEKQCKRAQRNIDRLVHELLHDESAKRFEQKYKKQIDLRSALDLRRLFFYVKKYQPFKVTSKTNPSVDQESLEYFQEEYQDTFAEKLLVLRKWEKINSTYLSGIMKEAVNGKVHPFFSLATSRSYRSSSHSPNFQNIPVRDELAKKIVRRGIIAHKGWQLMEVDYSGIEVRIGACYHKDKNMIEYICNPDSDMHRDCAADIWLLDKNDVTKELRFYAKNQWVFPQFYGDWYGRCAEKLWRVCRHLKLKNGMKVEDWIKTKGITCFDDFVQHCKQMEDKFWNQRFRGYQQWKEEMWEFYLRKGYVETFFGFRFTGYMDFKRVNNYPIQATAFHCLLWSLIQIEDELKPNGMRTKILGEIHDSIIFEVWPPEREQVIQLVREVMTQRIRKQHDWIIVPLDIDIEIAPVGGSWDEKQSI